MFDILLWIGNSQRRVRRQYAGLGLMLLVVGLSSCTEGSVTENKNYPLVDIDRSVVDGVKVVTVEKRNLDDSLVWSAQVIEEPGHGSAYTMGAFTFHGAWIKMHSNGQISERGSFRHGRKHGKWTCWNKDGQIIANIVYP